jgi:DNA-binding winged helix-turn-helix (wHTH) protein
MTKALHPGTTLRGTETLSDLATAPCRAGIVGNWAARIAVQAQDAQLAFVAAGTDLDGPTKGRATLPARLLETARISFGPFDLLPTQRLLLESGKPLHVGSRALDILIALAERPGEIVSKDELMACVWPNTYVSEDNIKTNVAALRRVLGDGRPGRRYMLNVHGRGYVFVAPVRRQDASIDGGGHSIPRPSASEPRS